MDYIEILCRERLEMSIRYSKEIRKWQKRAKKWKIRAQAKTREEQESEVEQEEAQELRRKKIIDEDCDETESEDEAPKNSEETRMSSQSL